ncbi:MAG: OmpA family protein [Bacteroidetes bacterium]|nr:OmpA family protein [Bacteroidota bacterium]
MLRKLLITVLSVSLLTSCVSKKVYTELENNYDKLRKANMLLTDENTALSKLKSNQEASITKLKNSLIDLELQRDHLKNKVGLLQSEIDKLTESYELLSSQSSAALAENAKKNQNLLAQLEEKERELSEENERLKNLQREMNARSNRINELERLIAAKEEAMKRLKNAISNALSGFEGKGLTVVHKNGKVYVSMENKLLFSSGSWAVGSEGHRAVVQLANVLAENKEIEVLIEGHTDNVPYTGAVINDNWDLSVKRATAIVRILQDNNVSPKRITAAGRSEYNPIDSNASAEGKAKNRRIEIILTPNLDEVSKLLNE